ncbi:MAG: NAD-dependent epimerase/dehydratase family protein [Leptonema sp. (in: bacteria)]
MNVLITGASGYIGLQLVKQLEKNQQIHSIIAIDIKKNIEESKKTKFYLMDIRDKKILELLQKHKIDTVIHLAAIVNPTKHLTKKEQYSIDVIGTTSIMKYCAISMVKRFIITSSGAVYGYHPDNPIPIHEGQPLRGNKEFAYSYHKTIIEKRLDFFKQKYPHLKQFIFRVSTILGEKTSNQISDLFKKKFLIGIQGSDSPFCFVWDQDVINCLEKAIFCDLNKSGIYNLSGDGYLKIQEISEILNKKIIYFPPKLLSKILKILYKLKISQYSSEQILFLQYRPVLDNSKLKNEFGYIPKKTSKEVFLYFAKNL